MYTPAFSLLKSTSQRINIKTFVFTELEKFRKLYKSFNFMVNEMRQEYFVPTKFLKGLKRKGNF